MELYVPYKALINTKGAAANIMVTINGGNGYHWHYIPTAICLDGPKSIFPTIVGTGNTATLILSMTGAEMKVPHSTIFITIIAWAYAPNGQLVKTSATKEIPFHSKGLEAVRGKNDTLKITYYGDSNLDGIAEITELNADEYDISEDSDSLIITAKDFRLGSCKIPKINP